MTDERPFIRCRACLAAIFDGTPYWRCPPLGACCDACWPEQARNHLREFRTPRIGDVAERARADGSAA